MSSEGSEAEHLKVDAGEVSIAAVQARFRCAIQSVEGWHEVQRSWRYEQP
jgi:hypothetical protein